MHQQGFEESQAGESPVLRALLPNDPVVYVDVGVGDYADWNVTWPFYKAGGHGLLVEPREEMWPDYIKERPRDVLCTSLAHDRADVLPLRIAGEGSSVREDWDIDHIFEGVRYLRAEPLRDILARYSEIRDTCQLCSIDVEGAEREAILGIDWSTFRPEVVLVEYIFYNKDTVGRDISGSWRGLLVDDGKYREACRSWLNIIYIRSDLWDRWEAVRDTVELPHATLEETKQHIADKYGV